MTLERLRKWLRRYWLWLVAGAIALFHVFLLLKIFVIGGYDIELYYTYADNMWSGMIPYRDFAVEYPPGALLVFLLPRIFASSLGAYTNAFSVLMLLGDLACLFMMIPLARRLKLSPVGTMLIYTAVVASANSITIQRFDFAAAALCLGALLAFSRGRYKTAWAILALGMLVKLYPAALAPLFLIYQWRHQRWRSLVRPLVMFCMVILLVALPFFILSPSGFIDAFALQGGRNLQIESSYASVLFMIHALGGPQVSVFQGPVSWDMSSPYAEGIAQASMVLMVVTALLVYLSYYLPSRRHENPHDDGPPPPADLGRLINYSLLIIMVLLLTSKVFSTQYIVWPLPLLPLVTGRSRHAVWPVFVAAGLLTWYTYPTHYWDLRNLLTTPMAVIFVRNVLLALIAFWLWRLKEPEPEAAPETQPLPLPQ
jgi:hypothetical protein